VRATPPEFTFVTVFTVALFDGVSGVRTVSGEETGALGKAVGAVGKVDVGGNSGNADDASGDCVTTGGATDD
jgi:hypothetical protein